MTCPTTFYDQYDEDCRLVSTRPGQLEFAMSVKVIDAHIRKVDTILELGSGSGRYSVHYAQKGHAVTAVELSSAQTDLIRQKKKDLKLQNLTVHQGNATELGFLKGPFDAILCLGPYYHLRDKEDRLKMLAECKRLLADDGTLFVAYINKYFGIPICQAVGTSLGQEELSDILAGKNNREHGTDPFLDIAYMSDKDSAENELAESGFEIVDHTGVDGIYPLARERLEEQPDENWQRIVAYHESVMRHPSVIGSSSHGLVACRLQGFDK